MNFKGSPVNSLAHLVDPALNRANFQGILGLLGMQRRNVRRMRGMQIGTAFRRENPVHYEKHCESVMGGTGRCSGEGC